MADQATPTSLPSKDDDKTGDEKDRDTLPDAKMASAEDQALVKQIRERLTRRRWLTERNWWGNILFHLGIQWITYDNGAQRWRQRKLSPSVPTPITNLFRATLDTVKSALAQHAPRFIGTPERDTPSAIAGAQSADENLDIILAEGKFEKAKRRNLDWLTLTGNGIIEIVWDDSPETGEVPIPYDVCSNCGKSYPPGTINADLPQCPECGSPFLTESETEAIMVPRGSIRFDTKSPFETFIDPVIEELEDQPHVMFIESYTTEQVEMQWGKTVPSDSGNLTTSGFLRQSAGSIATPGIGIPFSAMSAMDREHRVTVIRLFSKRNKAYPKGCYIVLTSSGHELEKHSEFPWKRKGTEKKYYPFTLFRFGTVGGRAWGYTPADDLLPKQYQLNKAESLFTLIMTRMANPVWLIPTNTNPTRITGEIGIQIEYTPVGQAAPQRIPGAEAPQSLVTYITDIRRSFDELSGAFDAVRGRSMGSRTPVGTVQTLSDRGFGRWATVFGNLEEGYEDMARKALEVWRQNAKTPRVRAIRNLLGGWSFNEFMGADWDEGVDISVEAGSSRPRTQQQKLQTYVQLAQYGFIDIKDQSQVIKILQDVGLSNLLPGVQEDTKAAYAENANFMLWARSVKEKLGSMSPSVLSADPGDVNTHEMLTTLMSMPDGRPLTEVFMVQPLVDAHDVHFLTHRRFALTQDFRALPEVCKAIFYRHMATHQSDLIQSKLYLQLSTPGEGQALPGQPPGGQPQPQPAPQPQQQNPAGHKPPGRPTPGRPAAPPQPPPQGG